MVFSYMIIIFFAATYYYVTSNGNSRFAATASAIRQIWSGNCRLSCRSQNSQSQNSRMSLSGLVFEAPCQQAGPSSADCFCARCPCAMIDNILRGCSPATRLYSNVSHTLSHYYYNLVKSVVEIYEYASRVLECGASCQRKAKIIDVSSENFSLGDPIERKAETSTVMSKFTRSATDLTKAKQKSSVSFIEPLKSENSSEGGSSSGERGSDVTLTPAEESGSCSKCVEEGKTCISKCPRAKKP